MKKLQLVYSWHDGWRVHHTTSLEVYRMMLKHNWLRRSPKSLPNYVLRFLDEQGVEIYVGDWQINYVTCWQKNAMDQIQLVRGQLQSLENVVLYKQRLTLI